MLAAEAAVVYTDGGSPADLQFGGRLLKHAAHSLQSGVFLEKLQVRGLCDHYVPKAVAQTALQVNPAALAAVSLRMRPASLGCPAMRM